MATLNVPQSGKAVKGSSRKPTPRVDLTAMVDLAFLLITFFMLTTSLSKMSAMEIAKPVPIDDITQQEPWPASRTLTVLLGKDDKVAYYLGEAAKSPMQIANLSEIRNTLLANQKIVAETHKASKDQEMYVIIKPTSTSVYKNFVDVIDEMGINKINTYAIDDKYLLDEEKSFMSAKGI
ncbi:ExbD/TolR family protein [Pedobacter ureilyticus]|uniref:ExbD/TolR family protein n=1 Tax=Pedobacter ureilyticus TaxID=1393051 RepID=A0ABW9J7X9_9SPHI|nr:biopolymer transporter ExbD [Pedobacter helvus]